MMGNLGSNTQPSAIQGIAKSLGIVDGICRNFEAEASLSKGYYSYPSFAKDLSQILQILEQQRVFEVQEGRTIKSYSSSPLLSSLKWNKLIF